MNFDAQKKPEDIACKLFENEESKANENENNEMDFTMYLSKTIAPGHPVQRDLLTSFNTPQHEKENKNKLPSVTSDDLMVFASPIAQPVFSKENTTTTEESPSN